MRKIRICFGVLLLALFVLSGCREQKTTEVTVPTESLAPTERVLPTRSTTPLDQSDEKVPYDTNKYIIQTPYYQIYEEGLGVYKYRIKSGNQILVENVKTGTDPRIEDKGGGILSLHLGFGTNAFTVKYFDVYNKTVSKEFHPYTIYADYVDDRNKVYYLAYFKPEESPKLYIEGFFDSAAFSSQLDLNFAMPTCEKLIFLNETELYLEYYDKDLGKTKRIVNFRDPINSESLSDNDAFLLKVLNNKLPFINEKGEQFYLKDYKSIYKYPEDTTYYEKENIFIPRDYAFVDLDRDGLNELVVSEAPYGDTYLILHKSNDVVYGYCLYTRWFQSLKTDGTFMATGGAVSNCYRTISFHQNTYAITTLATFIFSADEKKPSNNRFGFEPDYTESTFEIDGKAVSLAQIEAFAEEWSNRSGVTWIKVD